MNSLYRNPLTRVMMGVQFALQRRGPMTMPPSTLGCFARSSPAHAHANIEWHVQPLSLPAFGQPLHPFDAITPSVCNLRPSSRGSVHITSPAAGDAPAIQPNYLSTEDDRQVCEGLAPHRAARHSHASQVARESVAMTRRIMSAAALKPYNPVEIVPGVEVGGDDERLLDKAIGDIGTTIFHPVGTCR